MKKKKALPTAGISVPDPVQEKKWKAESDARTLCEAEAIKKDRERMRLAAQAAQKMAKDKAVEAMDMKKVAGGKMTEQAKFERSRMKQGAKAY